MSKIIWKKDNRAIREGLQKCLKKVVSDFYDYVIHDIYEDEISWDEYFTEGEPITAKHLMEFFQDRADWYFKGDTFPQECDTATWYGTDESVPLYQKFVGSEEERNEENEDEEQSI
jgi:hypothetical protein